MVLGQVGEHGDREADSGRPPERERVRGDLHRAGLVAGVEHAAKGGLEIDRLGRRPLDLLLHAADHLLHGPEEPGPDPLGLEHVPDQEGGRRLAVGAGDPGDPQARAVGSPQKRTAIGGIAARASATRTWATGKVQEPLDHQGAAPLPTASAAKSWPSERSPRTQKNRVPGSTRRLS